MNRSVARLAPCALAIASLALSAVVALAADPVPRATPETPAPAATAPARPEPVASAVEGAPTLDGIWMFDAKHSDDPVKIMQANRPQGGGRGPGGGGGMGGGGMGGGGWGGGRRGGGGGMGGGGWGGGRRGGGGGGDDVAGGDEHDGPAPGADNADRPRVNPFEHVMKPAKKLVIDLGTDQVSVTEDEQAARAYAIQDSLKAHEHDLVTEGTSASWKAGRLIMTQTLGRRGSLVETYELSADGKTLTIRAHREGGAAGMPNPTLVRVYTRYEGD